MYCKYTLKVNLCHTWSILEAYLNILQVYFKYTSPYQTREEEVCFKCTLLREKKYFWDAFCENKSAFKGKLEARLKVILSVLLFELYFKYTWSIIQTHFKYTSIMLQVYFEYTSSIHQIIKLEKKYTSNLHCFSKRSNSRHILGD